MALMRAIPAKSRDKTATVSVLYRPAQRSTNEHIDVNIPVCRIVIRKACQLLQAER